MIHKLSERLAGELPGNRIQSHLSPAGDRTAEYYQHTDTSRIAAVMALLHGHEDALYISLIKRASHPHDLHAGQISFPGGGMDDIDDSLVSCALRETEEETGISWQDISVIGKLTPLFVFASDNMVHPFVGYYRGAPNFNADPREVASIINIPLTYITRPEIVSKTELNLQGYKLSDVPYYDVNGHVLWGATAMMMAELIHLLQDIQ